MKKLLTILVAGLMLLSLASCDFEETSGSNDTNGTDTKASDTKKELSFGDTITFDELEITFHSDGIEWTTVENEYSDHNGADVFSVPMTIKNIKDETHGLNMFYYSVYGAKGTKVDDISSYFDGDVSMAGDMRTGASIETKMHILYDGNGDYYVEFSQLFGDKIEVKLPIAKP